MAEKTKVISEAKKQARERSIVFDLPRLLLKSPSGMLGLIIVLVVVFVAIFADFIIPCTPEEIDLLNMAQPPCWAEGGSMDHILGTDILGRDIFSRILVGSRVSLLVGIFSVVVAGLIGTVMGVLSGYFGGWIDSVVMRITDAFYSIPLTLFAMVMLTIMDPGVLTLVFVIGVTNWPFYARMVRGEVLGLKNKEYVKAARTIGTKPSRILRKHILPNCLSVIIISVALQVPSAIFTESYLSFLGLGVSQPMPSLGSLANEARGALQAYPFQLVFPALMICLIVLSLNLLGDGLRDAFDPKLRR